MDPAQVDRTVAVFVVIPPGVLLLDVAGPMEVLRRANLEQQSVRFVVTYVGPNPATESSIGLHLAGISPLPEALPANAMVIIPGSADRALGSGTHGEEADADAEAIIVQWLAETIRPGMRLVSICSGALLAGRAGLLDGYDCTTHHGTTSKLMVVAPMARVLENRLYVDGGERLTTAGVTAGIDLMLHIVEKEAGSRTALAVARHLVVYIRRAGADPQLSAWLAGRNHIHPVVHKAQDAIAENPSQAWPLAHLAKLAGASTRNLSRLFNEHAGMSVTDFVNRLRIAVAHELVIASRLDMEGVAERAGFASTRQFRRVWNSLHAIPPSRVRAELGHR